MAYYCSMREAIRKNTVTFTTKGQVVIPSWLRKEYEIKEGTLATIHPIKEGILLKPITTKQIKRLRGSLRTSKAMEIFLSERRREREI